MKICACHRWQTLQASTTWKKLKIALPFTSSESLAKSKTSSLCLFYSCFTFRSRKILFFLHRWWGGMEVLKVCTLVHYNFFHVNIIVRMAWRGGEKMKSSCEEIHAPIKREQKNVKRISEFLFLLSWWWQSGFFSFPLRQIMNGTFSINYFTSSVESLRPLITRSIYLRGDHK